MNIEGLNWFITCYILLGIAIFFALIDSLMLCGVLVGLSVFSRSMVSISPPSAIYLIQKSPVWKWFSVIYLFVLLAWLITNMNNDYLYQLNPFLAIVIFFFPLAVPYVLNEYKIYKCLKSKKSGLDL